MFSARPAIAPGHEVQVDSSPFDVLALGDDGKPIRAKMTIMLVKATQSIIATSVNVRGTKGVDLAFMLAQCLTLVAMLLCVALSPASMCAGPRAWTSHSCSPSA